MAQFLAVQVRLGSITIEQVPERYKSDVQQKLDSMSD